MQTTTEATHATKPCIRRDCSIRLYFSMKESDHILSELRWRDSGDDVCLQLGVFGKSDNFGG